MDVGVRGCGGGGEGLWGCGDGVRESGWQRACG